MKYLTKYKIFESTLIEIEMANTAKQEIEDVLLYLRDEGFNINVEVSMDYHASIFVRILNYDNKPVKYYNIKDDIERVIKVAKINHFVPTIFYYKMVQEDGRIFNRNNREVCNWEMWKRISDSNPTIAFLTIEFAIKYKEIKNEIS